MKLVAGNWKMQGSRQLVYQMAGALRNLRSEQLNIVIFPPYLYLTDMAHQLEDSGIQWGAQNCSRYENGAYTGEVSAQMLADIGCRYVIIGHSERRTLYGETDAIVADKVAKAINSGLTPIFCIGENQAEREAGTTQAVLEKQLAPIISLFDDKSTLSRLIVAYEPIWAIGTGKTATPELAQQTHSEIRQFLAQYAPSEARSIKLLYGGSVKPDNASQLITLPDVDGFLVGGASLDPTQFISICQAAIEGR